MITVYYEFLFKTVAVGWVLPNAHSFGELGPARALPGGLCSGDRCAVWAEWPQKTACFAPAGYRSGAYPERTVRQDAVGD